MDFWGVRPQAGEAVRSGARAILRDGLGDGYHAY